MVTNKPQFLVERVQTGVRMEKRLLKVLKALAEYHDMSLGDLLEGIVLHAFDGKSPFGAESLKRIQDLKKFYSLDLDSSASHRLTEIKRRAGSSAAPKQKIHDRKISEKKKSSFGSDQQLNGQRT
ncbi:MAG TPA: hypothetical protein VK828_14850 [Terriglobales bacterium]|jgi:hypothetical protein|nr:hypothetical protein [Terriglobales bacterium]